MAELDFSVLSALLETLRAEQIRLGSVLLTANTHKGYRYDWSTFVAWCSLVALQALPASADTIALYVTAELKRGQKVSSVKRKVCGILHVHKTEGRPAPATDDARLLLKAAKRDRTRDEGVRRVNTVTITELRMICVDLLQEDTPLAIRNRAILVVGFASALRAANLAALTLADVSFGEEGARLAIRREKQDQEGQDGEGRVIGLPHGKHLETCPVQALRDWMERRGAFPGPLFTRFSCPSRVQECIQPERICQLVQAAVKRIGLDPKLFGGHSLRASFITAAVEANIDELLIMGQTGHHDRRSLKAYFRRRDVFRSNPCLLLDL